MAFTRIGITRAAGATVAVYTMFGKTFIITGAGLPIALIAVAIAITNLPTAITGVVLSIYSHIIAFAKMTADITSLTFTTAIAATTDIVNTVVG